MKTGKKWKLMTVLGAGAAVFTADQLLKASIERQAADTFPRDVPGTGGAARYEKCHNKGLLMGAMQEDREMVQLLPAISAAALGGRLFEMLSGKGKTVEAMGLSIVLGGAMSNLYDRMLRGYVVDYLSIKKGFLKKMVINLGDAAIFAGGILAGAAALCRELPRLANPFRRD